MPSACASSFAVHERSLRSALMSSGVTKKKRYHEGASLARGFRYLLFCALGLSWTAAGSLQGCGSDDGPLGYVDDDAGKANTRSDAAAGDADAEAPLSTLRLAHMATGVGPVDFCYQAARAGSFEGPVLGGPSTTVDDAGAAGDADADADASIEDQDAGRPSVTYGAVSKYFTLAATGTIVVEIVPAGARCSEPIAQGTVTLDPGKLSTVVFFAEESDASAAAVVGFVDDRDTLADKARVRIIHASAAGPIAVRANTSRTTTLAERVDPRHASEATPSIPVDALGFATVTPIPPPVTLVVDPIEQDASADAAPSKTATWASAAGDLDLRGDSLHTGFVLDEDGGFVVLWCADKSTVGDRTACTWVR
jgi:hypothetical protein